MANIKKRDEGNPESTLTLNQRVSNNHNKLLASEVLDSLEFSEEIQKQVYGATACCNSLYINEANNMRPQYTCKKRFCILCAQKYAFKRDLSLYPAVKDICDKNKADSKRNARLWLVTLTLPTCLAGELSARLDELQDSYRAIYNEMIKVRKKSYLNGIRKLEVNPNLKAGILPSLAVDYNDYRYHAHLHILVQGMGNAYELRRRWLARHPEANKSAQDVRPFDHEKGTLVELVKYISKPAAAGESKCLAPNQAVSAPLEEAGMVKDSTWTNRARRSALVYIYDCLRGRRTIFTYGTIKKSKKITAAFYETEEGKKEMHGWISEEFLASIMSLEKEQKELKKQAQTPATTYRLKQIKQQLERLNSYVNSSKRQASRDLADTLWTYAQGHYINKETGEQLCTEEEVEAADLSKDKKTYRLTKKAIERPEKKSPKKKKTTAELIAAMREELKKEQMGERQYAMAKSIQEEALETTEPRMEPSRREKLKEECDHSLLYFRNREAYESFLFRQEKERIELGLSEALTEEQNKFEVLVKRGRERQKVAYGCQKRRCTNETCRKRKKRKPYFIP